MMGMDTNQDTLGDALPREMARVRDVLLPAYDSVPGGKIAASMMRADLDGAAKAMAEGDVGEMLRRYQSLKEWAL